MDILIKRLDLNNMNQTDYDTLFVEDNEASEIYFASYMWRKLLREDFGDGYFYVRDYEDYTDSYDTFSYRGEGIYDAIGNCIMHVEALRMGVDSLTVDNIKYFI